MINTACSRNSPIGAIRAGSITGAKNTIGNKQPTKNTHLIVHCTINSVSSVNASNAIR